MSAMLRRFAILATLALLALLFTGTLHASARVQLTAPESMLLQATNRDRAAAGLAPLQWDVALAAAAHAHALRMAEHNTLSHQFPGEPPLQDRARKAGAHFGLIAENVAEGPSVPGLHTQWMNSAPHRANLLDPELNAIGIAVVKSGNILFAVEDFSAAVPEMSFESQENQIAAHLASYGLYIADAKEDARKTCEMERGWAGQRPAVILRYETGDLSKLPADVEEKLQNGKFKSAAVGACEAPDAVDFVRYRIAILLYRPELAVRVRYVVPR
jgi:hypothetical protein